MSKELIRKVKELFSYKKYITPWLLSEKLNIDLKDARTLYNEFKKYCLSEGKCIEYKGILYKIGFNTAELIGKEQEKILEKADLPRIIYMIIKNHQAKCIPLDELFIKLRKHGVRIPSPYILEAIATLYRRGLIYEKQTLCYSAS